MTGKRCDHCGRGLYWWNGGFGWFCDFCGDSRPNGGVQRCGHIPAGYERVTALTPLTYGPKTVDLTVDPR